MHTTDLPEEQRQQLIQLLGIEKLKKKNKKLESRITALDEYQKEKLEHFENMLRVLDQRVCSLKRDYENWRWNTLKGIDSDEAFTRGYN